MRASRLLFMLFAAALAAVEAGEAAAAANEAGAAPSENATASTESVESSATGNPPPAKPQKDDKFDAVNHRDWGSYYDPQNIFCGKYDCYKILGLDYESFDRKHPPDRKEITQRYRKLSRAWHPDKSKHWDAKNRFVKIARAYEVLTNEETRTEYDDLRYDQEAYYQKYGSNVLWRYAPKTDTTIVVLLLLVAGNVFSWYSQKHRWQLVADRLIKAAVEDWTPSQGGTPESKELREHALQILQERESDGHGHENGKTNGNATAAAAAVVSAKKKKKGDKKLSGKERRQLEHDALEPIVKELVNEMKDFGHGFHQPTWRDLLVVTLAKLPGKMARGVAWNTAYCFRRLQGKDLNDAERLWLTQTAVGPIVWETSSAEEQVDMLARELWKTENLADWGEEQEIKKLSAAEQKYYYKLKKKGQLDKFGKDD